MVGRLMLAVCVALAGCGTQRTAPLPPRVGAYSAEPVMRVRVASGVGRLIVGDVGPITIGDAARMAKPYAFYPPVTITRRGAGYLIQGNGQKPVQWDLPTLRLTGRALTIGDRQYPDMLVVTPGDDHTKLDAIHHVPLEQYLPGVLAKELYADWEPAAFEAQAIAARSYAIWEQSVLPRRHYDLEATVASQAYVGRTDNPRALEAVRRTRGQVLVYEGRIVPAFYSSTGGGRSQDAVAVFADRAPDIKPLWGGPRGDWDRDSPYYRWGPIHRDKRNLTRRIRAWGAGNGNRVAHLRGIASIQIAKRSRSGRPAAFVITDERGRHYELHAEQLRQACNHDAAGLPPVDKAHNLRSSDVRVTVGPRFVSFTGHGYGHGVGMSQFGAQALAQHGYDAPAILAHYYPGARIERAY